MPNQFRATLVAEIGSTVTRVTLVDIVDGEARLIGQAEVPTTTDPPHENALVGILSGAVQISDLTGRQLLRDHELLMPQTNECDGVDAVVAVTSAADLMGVVITAIAGDVSARSALHASRATYTSVLQVVTLDNAARTTSSEDTTWIERQVQMLVGLRPDVVIIAGGLEGGAEEPLKRLAHIVGLTALHARVDAQGQQRHEVTARPVLFAGNSQAREQVIEALSGRAEPILVENVRPSLDIERLDPTRRALIGLYNDRILPKLPGMPALRRLCALPVGTVSEAAGLMTRFIAAHYRRATLTLDAGSATTAAFLASQGCYTPAIMGGVGTGYGLGGVLAECGVAAIARWLPFPISDQELLHRLLNKMLRPALHPTTREDVWIEHAVARETLVIALAALYDERPTTLYDFVVASGGVLAHAPHPGLTALTLLDALQPTSEETVLAIELHVDTLGLLGACGALALTSSDAALLLFERDLLRNTPLATCVVALGGRAGEVALEAELKETGGRSQVVSVQHGQIARLALPPGSKGTLTLRPVAGVRVGRNPPGVEVPSEPGAISGSALGVIIDARSRPLQLPEDSVARQQLLWSWLVALGVEQGPFPYAVAQSVSEVAIPMVQRAAPVVEQVSPADPKKSSPPSVLKKSPPPSNPPIEIEQDLARLRQTVEKPKRRGFLRRK